MLVKLTSKNQSTLPKSEVQLVTKAECYDVVRESGRIISVPVRAKLEPLDIDEIDVNDAIAWARRA